MENVDIRLLREIADLETTPQGAYNIRKNGELASRNTTANIDIVSKTDKPGIDIYIKDGTKHQSVAHPGAHHPDRAGRSGVQRLPHRRRLRRGHRGRLRYPQRGQPRDQARRGAHLLHRGELPGAVRGEALRRGGGHRRAGDEPQDRGLSGKRAPSSRWTPPSCGGWTPPSGTPRWW